MGMNPLGLFPKGPSLMFHPEGHQPFDPQNQRYRDYARQRQMTLGDLLLENRIVFLAGSRTDGRAIEIVMKLLYVEYENKSREIHFYIASPGGSVTGTLSIYDTMQ